MKSRSTTKIANRHNLVSFDSQGDAREYLVDIIADELRNAISSRGRAIWLAAGGGTPKPLYEELANKNLEWEMVKLVVLDERFVPISNPQSNQAMIADIFSNGAASQEIIGLIDDINDIENSAALAEAHICALCEGELPKPDFALLGMGPDGHYASIFPQHPANATIYQSTRLVVPISPSKIDSLEPKIARLTLTPLAINQCRNAVFYITGHQKLDVLNTMANQTDPFISPIGAFLAQASAPISFIWAP